MTSTTAAPRDAGRCSDFDLRSLAVVCAVSALVMLVGLGTTRLWDEDEGYFASTAAEMFARNDWVKPTFNGELFGHKPPLMYWGMMAGFRVFGVNELGARAVSALFGIATALATCILGTRLFNRRVGMLAGIVMGSSIMFSVVARAATPDAHLTFFAVVALYCFARHGGLDRQFTWLGWLVCYIAMAFGVLAKGPIGLLFPMAVIGLYLLMTTPVAAGTKSKLSAAWQKFGLVNFFRTIWRMRPITAILVTLAIAGPWFYLVNRATNGEFLNEFIFTHHLQRATTAMDNHSGPWFYYLVTCSIGLFPWSVFTVPAGIEWIRGLQQRIDARKFHALLLLASWAGVYLVIFSIPQTKLPNYVLPAYPALALAVAYYLDAWLSAPKQVNQFLLRGSFAVLGLCGLLTAVVLMFAGRQFLGDRTLLDLAHIPWELQQQAFWLSVIGVPGAIGGVLGWLLIVNGKNERACQVLVASAIATLLLLWNVAAPVVDRYQSPQTIAAHLRDRSSSPMHIVTLNYFRPTMLFYSKQTMDCFKAPTDAARALQNDSRTFLITTSSELARLQAALPPETEVEVIERLPGFPSKQDILVLARRGTLEWLAAENKTRR